MKNVITSLLIILLIIISIFVGLNIFDKELKIVITDKLKSEKQVLLKSNNINSSGSVNNQFKITEDIKKQSSNIKIQVIKTIQNKKDEINKMIPNSPEIRGLKEQIYLFFQGAKDDMSSIFNFN